MKRAPYPLQWPQRLARTPAHNRRRSPFGGAHGAPLSPHKCAHEVSDELRRLRVSSWVITSYLPAATSTGIPFSDTPRIHPDPGIAVWFEYRRVERVLACDAWIRADENLRAIAKSIEAMRGLERWGVADILASVFTGFAPALPPGDAPIERPWREVLGGLWPLEMDATDLILLAKARHRRLVSDGHIDAGGTSERMLELNLALQSALREIEGGR